jgi:hypothetical protein
MNIEADVDKEVLPEKLQGNFGDFSPSDVWFTVALLAVAMIAWVQVNFVLVPVVIVVWVFLMLRSHKGGRRYYLAGASIRSYWRVRVRKGRSSRRVDKEGDSSVGNRVGKRRGDNKKAGSDITFALTSVPSDLDGETIGIMHVKRAHTDSFVVISEGADIASTPLASQHESYELIAKMVARLVASMRGYSVGVSYLFRKDPFDMYELEANLENFLRPEMYVPSGMDVEEADRTDRQHREIFAAGVWAQLQTDVIPEEGRKVWMATVVTIKRTGALAKAESNRTIDKRYIKRLPINQMVKIVVSGLKAAGVTDPRPLDRGEIHLFTRGAWDTLDVDEYHGLVAEDPEAPYRDGFNDHWPREEMLAFNDYSRTDGNVAAVMRVSSNRKEEWQGYWPEYYTSLPGRYSCFALVGSAITSSREIWLLERGAALLISIGELLGVNYKTRSMQRREDKINRRADTIFESEFSQTYNILVTLRPEREEELEHEMADLETLGITLGITHKRIELAVHQYPALWSGTLAISGLL